MWTKELPTKDGYYWVRKNQYKNEYMVCVWADHDESIKKENEARGKLGVEPLSRYDSIVKVAQENKVFYVRHVSERLSDKTKLEELEGREWQGPLKPNENLH